MISGKILVINFSLKVYYVIFLSNVSVDSKAYCKREEKGDLRVAGNILACFFKINV